MLLSETQSRGISAIEKWELKFQIFLCTSLNASLQVTLYMEGNSQDAFGWGQ